MEEIVELKDIQFETTICNNCGSAANQLLVTGQDRLHQIPGQFTNVRCSNCSLVYMNPRPVEEKNHLFYPMVYGPHRPQATKKPSRKFWSWLNDRLWRHTINRLYAAPAPEAELLEIGCGAGDFLLEAKRLGWQVTGTEVSKTAVHHARKLGLSIHEGTLDTFPRDKKYDAIRLHFVLEHVHDPTKMLQEIRNLLKPGGFAHVAVPNENSTAFRWWRSYWYDLDMPRHLYLFSPQTFEALCVKSGLRLEKTVGEVKLDVFWNSFLFWLQGVGLSAPIAAFLRKLLFGITLPVAIPCGWALGKKNKTSRLHFVVSKD